MVIGVSSIEFGPQDGGANHWASRQQTQTSRCKNETLVPGCGPKHGFSWVLRILARRLLNLDPPEVQSGANSG
jgi:hypothetical protein